MQAALFVSTVSSALALALSVGCGPPLPDHGSSAAPPSTASFEPSAEADSVASVLRVHLASESLSSGEAALFQGSLSSYYLSKIRHGELPETLASRQIALMSWRGESELVVAPLRALALGPYSLAAKSGLLVEFQVSAVAPLLRRIWPASGLAGSPHFAVYCADPGAGAPRVGSWLLQPGSIEVLARAGVDDSGAFAEHCLHFTADELGADEIALPPPSVDAWAIDPSVFTAEHLEPALPLGCADGEAALGLGCAFASDDRALVRTPNARLLWVVHSANGSFVAESQAGHSLTLRGLSPSSHEHVWGTVHDEAGTETAFDCFIDTLAARARPVLNEALANALGPEPQSEWIEIVNDGSLELELSDYTLQDGGGISPLPAAVLRPQEFALLVRSDFGPNASDVPPAAGARLIAMPALGKSGLSNSGERLALLDKTGHECSALPALPAKKPGQSLARRALWSLDSDASAFSFGIPTPGLANDVEGELDAPAMPAAP